jgi:hypothetical protein
MHVRSRHALRATLVAGLVLFAARPAHAQALALHTPPADVAAPKAAPAGPTMASASVAVRPVEVKELQLNAAAAPKRAGYGQPFALMVVGGAAVLTGVIIGGDAGTIIAVGGAVAGLVGLYQYLQ